MPDSLHELEKQRSAILRQVADLGDFRSGSITAITARCGKPTCHCHQPGNPGHGPNFRLTRKVKGKTVTETFATPAALRKTQREVTEFHRFRRLSHDLLAVNEKICPLRPVEEALTPEEKKRPQRSSKKSITK